MVTLILWILFLLSLYREPRSLINPPLFIITLISTYFSIGDFLYNSHYVLLTEIIFVGTFLLAPLMAFFIGIFFIFNGITVLRREGKSLSNMLSLALGIAIIGFYIVCVIYFFTADKLFVYPALSSYVFITFVVLTFSYFTFGFAFIGLFLYSILYHFLPKRKNFDFIIIHGAGLMNGTEVTPLLRGRIETALKAYYRSTNPELKLIASGGQGSDEKISEARAIANYLEKQGIPSDRIILEDKSTTTYENLIFSKQIAEGLIENPKYLFVTNDYHVFRTSYYAKKIGMKGNGVGSKTARYYFPTAFIREYIALVVKMKWVFIVLYSLLGIAIFLATR